MDGKTLAEIGLILPLERALIVCSQLATLQIMYTINTTNLFDEWLVGLRDIRARARIVNRIKNAESGNFGDCEPVGAGINEMRIHLGAGYRVYFVQRESVVYLLLCGGDKSTQKRDIARAEAIKKQLDEELNHAKKDNRFPL